MSVREAIVQAMAKDREIAKDIIVTMLVHEGIHREEFPDADSFVDVVCLAYQKVLKAVQQDWVEDIPDAENDAAQECAGTSQQDENDN